jgi:hypothetical protein
VAVRWPQRVARLALVCPVGYEEWPARELRSPRMLPLTRHLPPTFLLGLLRKELQRGYTDRGGDRSIHRYLRPFATAEGRDALVEHLMALDAAETTQLAPRLRDLVMPTTIVAGAHDPFVAARPASGSPATCRAPCSRWCPTDGTSCPRRRRGRWAEAVGRLCSGGRGGCAWKPVSCVGGGAWSGRAWSDESLTRLGWGVDGGASAMGRTTLGPAAECAAWPAPTPCAPHRQTPFHQRLTAHA